MKYDFDEVVNRRNTHCVKWDCMKENYGHDNLLPLWVADMDFKAPEEVINALVKRAEHGIYGYTGKPYEYYESIINWQKKRNNFDVKKEWLLFSPGVVSALNMAVLAYTNKGDKIIIQTPAYHRFFDVVRKNNRKLIENPLINNNGHYTIDFDDLEKKASNGVKMMIFCSPHNPTGRVWTKEELERIAEICIKNKIVLICDEIHSDIIYKGKKHIPIISLNGEIAQSSVICTSPSKTFNVAGLSTSTVIIPNENMRKKFNEVLEGLFIGNGNLFGTEALMYAYNYGSEWLDELLNYLEDNAKYAVNYINTRIPGAKTYMPEGTYLLWIDFRDTKIVPQDISKFITEKAGVALSDGIAFGTSERGFMRLNFACSKFILKEALEKIEKAIIK